MDKKFKIFVIVALLVLAVAVGVGIFLMINISRNNDAQQTDESVVTEEKTKNLKLEMLHMTDALNANLKIGKDGVSHIIRISVGVQINSKAKDYKTFTEKFSTDETIIRDQILKLIKARTYEEIMADDAQDTLAEEIKEMLNQLMDTEIVQAIYFDDFFIQ